MMTNLGHAPYLAIYLAAMIEGEAVFAVASVLVAAGKLNAVAVMLCGALGAATGDQFYFYLFRGTLRHWIARLKWPAVVVSSRRLESLSAAVERHQTATVLALRFAPGLRIAMAATCAWARVSAIRFSLLNLLSALVWAAALLALIAWAGPSLLTAMGAEARWAAGSVAIGLLLIMWRLSRAARE